MHLIQPRQCPRVETPRNLAQSLERRTRNSAGLDSEYVQHTLWQFVNSYNYMRVTYTYVLYSTYI